eukprot:6901659-Lingulodinium_polyedra.AAC.1
MVFAWSAQDVRTANRCGGRQSARLHHCATFRKRCTMTRSKFIACRPGASQITRLEHPTRATSN